MISDISLQDLLTLIDPMCEEAIKSTLMATFPDYGFLGEEDVAPGKEASVEALEAKLKTGNDFLFIVDPIDGTSNFVHGMPLSMPSIACAYKGEVRGNEGDSFLRYSFRLKIVNMHISLWNKLAFYRSWLA